MVLLLKHPTAPFYTTKTVWLFCVVISLSLYNLVLQYILSILEIYKEYNIPTTPPQSNEWSHLSGLLVSLYFVLSFTTCEITSGVTHFDMFIEWLYVTFGPHSNTVQYAITPHPNPQNNMVKKFARRQSYRYQCTVQMQCDMQWWICGFPKSILFSHLASDKYTNIVTVQKVAWRPSSINLTQCTVEMQCDMQWWLYNPYTGL